MAYIKEYKNGLKLVVEPMRGFTSVSIAVLVKTGSRNEEISENGISHFIEHTVFKGTDKRSSFEISDYIDRIGAQINAFTSKELTCYYTKSTEEHTKDCIEVLSDIFFNAKFDESELDKERGVIIEEINMSEDTPDELCLDLLAESYGGKDGIGMTILGPIKHIKKFTKKDVNSYMDKYYTADNVVISIAGNVKPEKCEELVDKYFSDNFKRLKSVPQKKSKDFICGNIHKYKKIEQSHLSVALPAFSLFDERYYALSVANAVFGGGMSSRLYQKIREELGLCYTVYSYSSLYKDCGVVEIYAGVNNEARDLAVDSILAELKRFNKEGITEQEFLRGKEQIKSSFILGKENTASQMLVFGKYLLFNDKEYNANEIIKKINSLTREEVLSVIKEIFTDNRLAVSSVGPTKKPIKI
ncbi:MAG: insulinase family protein [Clostridia bacterium]|nr:insulinase family protein [Clostridia bacterium]